MELTEKGFRISSWQIFLLVIIYLKSIKSSNIIFIFIFNWIWNFLEVSSIICICKCILESIPSFRVGEQCSFSWIKVTKIIEFLSFLHFSSSSHFTFVHSIIYHLHCLPVALSLEDIIHNLLCAAISSSHNPSVEFHQPYFLQENFHFLTWKVLDLVSDHLSIYSETCSTALIPIGGSENLHDLIINELSEIITTR